MSCDSNVLKKECYINLQLKVMLDHFHETVGVVAFTLGEFIEPRMLWYLQKLFFKKPISKACCEK